MKKISTIFILTAILSSCSNNAINWIIDNNNKSISIKDKNTINLSNNNICSKNNLTIFTSTDDGNNFFGSLLASSQFYYYTNLEKSLFLAMVELIRRPDLSSPESKFQFYFDNKLEQKYISFARKKDNTMPVIFGIDYLLKKYSKKNILQLATDVDKFFPTNISVDRGLENYIKNNKATIQTNSLLSNTFLRGDDPLTRFETFQRGNLTFLVNFYLKNKDLQSFDNYIIKNEFNYIQNIGASISKCNFDIKSDLDQINTDLAINDVVNYIGLSNNGEAYMTNFFSYRDKNINTINNMLFFKVIDSTVELPTCLIFNPINNVSLFLTSVDGRSKNQHLKHLIDYEIYNSNTDSHLNDILNFPRHLFLSGPDRILYESKKGRDSQLNFFLSMNFPIYHVEKLGNIIGFSKIKSNSNLNFLQDSRNSNNIICSK